MSMAAYGGHAEVARILMSHGATLDHQDVDQDTPLSLARNRGHRTLVMMIEEEMTRRAMEEG
jgi:ankyrin repeat protein